MTPENAGAMIGRREVTPTELSLLELIARQNSKLMELEQRQRKCEEALRTLDAALIPLRDGFKL